MCTKKITDNIVFLCSDAPKKNLEGTRAVIINYDDIDFVNSVSSGATVSDVVLKTGTTGYSVDWYKNLASAEGAYLKDAENVDGFTHSFLCRLANLSADNSERAHELKNGRFVMVYETKYKGAANADAFKIAGWENGLDLSELAFNSKENGSSMIYKLMTEEGDFEQYPYHVFLETDYDVSKATFDSLFSPV